MPGIKVLSVRITTKQLEDSAVTSAKIADSAVTNPKIADSAITTTKIADGAVAPVDISPDFVKTGTCSVDSVETFVSFPAAFPGTPEVVAVGINVTGVRVTYVGANGFSVIADALGSARYIAIYK